MNFFLPASSNKTPLNKDIHGILFALLGLGFFVGSLIQQASIFQDQGIEWIAAAEGVSLAPSIHIPLSKRFILSGTKNVPETCKTASGIHAINIYHHRSITQEDKSPLGQLNKDIWVMEHWN